ncbi:MAG: PHP domain-containing protein, partial [Acidobacteriota bacterium]
MRKALIVTAAIAAAVIFFVLATLPPRPRAVAASDPELARRTVAGAYHVHTLRSDGSGDRAAVAAAAARAGLRFVIVTDHGDATRQPEAPAYIGGVLCLDGVEVSTTGGHYVALGLGAAPYPLGGEAAAVVEDV